MRLALTLALGILLGACKGSSPTPTPTPQVTSPPRPPPDDPKADSLEALGAELRRLRAIRGHFGGAPGQWNDEVDRFGGRKHEVLAALGARLGARGTSRAQLLAIMSDPDDRARPGDDLWAFVPAEATADATEMLVYHWRGRHDFLYFLVRGDLVLRADWWMAYE